MVDRSIPGLARARVVNPVVRALLRSRAHRLLSGSLLLLEYTGRRTGRRHVLPVEYAPSGALLIVVAGQPAKKTWWRNFDAQPVAVAMCVRGQPCRADARRLVEGTEEHTRALRDYRARFPRSPIPADTPVVALARA